MVYVPFMKRSLISLVALDLARYTCSFGNKRYDLFYDSSMIGIGKLIDGWYKINLDLTFANLINIVIRKKKKRQSQQAFFNVVA